MDVPDSTGETPQTQVVPPLAGDAVVPALAERAAPASTTSDRDAPPAPAKGLKGLWANVRFRAALAVAGGIAVIGAIVAPLAGGQGNAETVANAATIAASVSGAMMAGDEAQADASAEGAAEEDAAPPRPTVWRVARLADDPAVTMVDGTMGKHTLLAALGNAGLPRVESHRIVSSLEAVRDVSRFDPKDTFSIARDKASGRVVAYEIASSPQDVWQAREDENADGTPRLVTHKLDLPSERVRVRKAVLVGTDLRASFAEAGLSPIDDVLAMLDDALDGHAELTDIRAGARIRLVATFERVDGAFVRWTSLDAVEYFPATAGAPPVRVYWFGEDDSHHGWFDAKGREPYHGGWRTPIPFARIASRFNPHRMHPVLHVVMPHNGVDFAAPSGAPVYATAAGNVISVGNEGPCGNAVQIAHPNGIVSVYCHLSRFAPGLHAGQHVEGRQLIAYVGATGRVTGPHLHFGIKKNGVFVDPMTLRLDGVRVVPRGKRDEFDRLRAALDEELDSIALPTAAPGTSEPPKPEGEGESFYEEP
ncbi:MAG TPA: M23 family metallopeptidase [Polyangiaceae bacterium]